MLYGSGHKVAQTEDGFYAFKSYAAAKLYGHWITKICEGYGIHASTEFYLIMNLLLGA